MGLVYNHQLPQRLHGPFDLVLVTVHKLVPHVPVLDNQPLGVSLALFQLLVPVLLDLLQEGVQCRRLLGP